jgi:hypothetical protein
MLWYLQGGRSLECKSVMTRYSIRSRILTFRNRQSSAIVAPKVELGSCGQAFPKDVALCVPVVRGIATGALKRRAPTGAWPYRTPRKESIDVDELVDPINVPVVSEIATVDARHRPLESKRPDTKVGMAKKGMVVQPRVWAARLRDARSSEVLFNGLRRQCGIFGMLSRMLLAFTRCSEDISQGTPEGLFRAACWEALAYASKRCMVITANEYCSPNVAVLVRSGFVLPLDGPVRQRMMHMRRSTGSINGNRQPGKSAARRCLGVV